MPKSRPQYNKNELDAVNLGGGFEKACFGNTDISMPFLNKTI